MSISIGDIVGIPDHVSVKELHSNKHIELVCNYGQISGTTNSSFTFFVPMDMEGIDMELANSYVLPPFNHSDCKHVKISKFNEIIRCHQSGDEDRDYFVVNEKTPYTESKGVYFEVDAVVHPINQIVLRKALYSKAAEDLLTEASRDELAECVEYAERLFSILTERNLQKKYYMLLQRSDKVGEYPYAKRYINYKTAPLNLYKGNIEKLNNLKRRIISKELFSGQVTDIINKEYVSVLLHNGKNNIILPVRHLINLSSYKQMEFEF